MFFSVRLASHGCYVPESSWSRPSCLARTFHTGRIWTSFSTKKANQPTKIGSTIYIRWSSLCPVPVTDIFQFQNVGIWNLLLEADFRFSRSWKWTARAIFHEFHVSPKHTAANYDRRRHSRTMYRAWEQERGLRAKTFWCGSPPRAPRSSVSVSAFFPRQNMETLG